MLCLGGMPRRRYEQGAVVARTRGVGDGEESALAVLRLDSFLALPPPRRHAGLVPGPKARPQHLPVDLEGVIPAQDVDRPVYSRLRSAAADGRGSTDGKRARGPCISHPRHNGALTRRPCPMAGRAPAPRQVVRPPPVALTCVKAPSQSEKFLEFLISAALFMIVAGLNS